jgi:predicted molibdopterin-dependent oxidoreductase YjgC
VTGSSGRARGSDDPGTISVHADGFLRGRGQLSVLEHIPSPERDVEGHPFILITGRVLQQYNVGTMTRRTPGNALASHDILELAPGDARVLDVGDDHEVEIESCWGRTRVRARASERITTGTAFLSFHHPETHANAVTGPQCDPESNCPEYKVTAVRIRLVAR